MHGDEVHSVPPRPQVTLLRFSLRRMLFYVGLLCVLFATVAATDGLLLMALLLVVLVGGAHVLSTFVGTRLRDGSTATSGWEAAYGLRPSEPYLAVNQPRTRRGGDRRPTARQLQERGPVVRRLSLLVASGSLIGVGGSVWLMVATFWPRIGTVAILAGGLASAILGGWIAFLGCSFFGITRRAWREAVEDTEGRPLAAPQTGPERTASDPFSVGRHK